MRFQNTSHVVLLVTTSSLALADCSVTKNFIPTPLYSASTGTVFNSTRGEGFESATITTASQDVTGVTISGGITNAAFTSNGSGFVVTIPADASSNSASDTATISNASFVGSTQAVFPTNTLEATITTTASQTMLIDKFGASHNLQYSEYGMWLEPGGLSGTSPITSAVFAFGIPTTTMPTTGSASYTGGASGIAATSAGGGEFAGTANFSANFTGNSITGAITGIEFSNSNAGTPGAITGTMNDINMTGGTISGTTFTGTGIAAGSNTGTGLDITGANTGRWGGNFNGPSAQEVAGTFQLTGGGNSAKVIGSFGAHQ